MTIPPRVCSNWVTVCSQISKRFRGFDLVHADSTNFERWLWSSMMEDYSDVASENLVLLVDLHTSLEGLTSKSLSIAYLVALDLPCRIQGF